MQPFDRKKHWENIYSEKSPLEVSWYQQEPKMSLQLIADTGASKTDAVIDIGGGASVLIDRLIERGYQHLSVLDLSSRALELVSKRLASKSHEVEFYAQDITLFRPAHPYAVWHDRAVFHFLTAATDREKYLASLKMACPAGGHVIIAAFAIGGPKKCSGLDIVQYDKKGLQKELGGDFDMIKETSENHTTPSGSNQKFGYFLFRRN